jgi:methylglutaconyl-CoA hydratase
MDKVPKTIKITEENGIAILTLNRPEKRNSLNREMVFEIKQALGDLKSNENISALVITGEGKAFCAGADLAYLKSLKDATYEENLKDSLKLKEMYYNIYTFPKPTIAMVNGPAVAGGCGLVNVCDFVFCTEHAKFGYPEVKIGFVAAMVSIFLAQSIGERNAKKLLLSGEILSARKAKQLNFVDEIIEEKKLWDYCLNFLSDLKQNSAQSIQDTKRLFSEIIFSDLEAKLEKACEFNAHSRNTNDFKEGISAFLEKRMPNWTKKSR